jgi:polyphosphate kinase 2 (PPK2 family)
MKVDFARYESGTPFAGDYEAALEDLQKRLSHLFAANLVCGRKAVIVCEGWDAAGKGGAIQRLTAQCDPRAYRVWPIAAPSTEEKAHHYLWRFWTRLPKGGEVAIFDRSWYGRVLVERVEGFATGAEWRRAFDEINEFEATLAADGTTIVKLFFHVNQAEQDQRLKARLEHPWKRWKVGEEDFRNRARRADYLGALADMFEHNDTRWAPWTVIDGNHKKAARIAALTRVAEALADVLPSKPPPFRPEVAQLAQQVFKISV